MKSDVTYVAMTELKRRRVNKVDNQYKIARS